MLTNKEARELATGALAKLALRMSVSPEFAWTDEDDGLTNDERTLIAWVLVQATQAIVDEFNLLDKPQHDPRQLKLIAD